MTNHYVLTVTHPYENHTWELNQKIVDAMGGVRQRYIGEPACSYLETFRRIDHVLEAFRYLAPLRLTEEISVSVRAVGAQPYETKQMHERLVQRVMRLKLMSLILPGFTHSTDQIPGSSIV